MNVIFEDDSSDGEYMITHTHHQSYHLQLIFTIKKLSSSNTIYAY
jgi:hypothetical protein